MWLPDTTEHGLGFPQFEADAVATAVAFSWDWDLGKAMAENYDKERPFASLLDLWRFANCYLMPEFIDATF